jgi:hypothetical protein
MRNTESLSLLLRMTTQRCGDCDGFIHDSASLGGRTIPVEGEACLGEDGRAEGEDGSAGYVGALVENVVDGDGGGPTMAEVVAGEEVELEERREDIGVSGVVVSAAAGAGGECEGTEAWGGGAELGGEALPWHVRDPVAD